MHLDAGGGGSSAKQSATTQLHPGCEQPHRRTIKFAAKHSASEPCATGPRCTARSGPAIDARAGSAAGHCWFGCSRKTIHHSPAGCVWSGGSSGERLKLSYPFFMTAAIHRRRDYRQLAVLTCRSPAGPDRLHDRERPFDPRLAVRPITGFALGRVDVITLHNLYRVTQDSLIPATRRGRQLANGGYPSGQVILTPDDVQFRPTASSDTAAVRPAPTPAAWVGAAARP
jgi:hypothetical protein